MTKVEFIKKAKILGYTNGWIENAINKMNELKEYIYTKNPGD